VHDQVGAVRDRGAHRPLTDRVSRDPPSGAIGLLDRRAHFLLGDLDGVRVTGGLGKPARRAHLDQVGAGRDILANAIAERRGPFHADALEVAGQPALPEPLAGRHHAWSRHRAPIDRVSQAEVGVADGAEVLDGREPGADGRTRVGFGDATEGEVHVRVDQAGQQRHLPEVGDGPACRR
jgi:hypothetical protein